MAKLKIKKSKTIAELRTPGVDKLKVDLQPHQVILNPRVTEKGMFQSQELNQYTFDVNKLANKTQIKHAVETLFEVEVEKVAVQNKKGKPRRYRFRNGRTKARKKAIVKLKGDHRIDFF